jgi:hypothetical protein
VQEPVILRTISYGKFEAGILDRRNRCFDPDDTALAHDHERAIGDVAQRLVDRQFHGQSAFLGQP